MRWIFLVKLALAASLLAWLAFKMDFEQFVSLFAAIPWYLFVVGAGIVLLQAAILASRWSDMTAFFAHTSLPLRDSFTVILISFFFSQGLPASIGGDAARIWLLKERSASVKLGIKAVLVDRFWGFLSLLALACAGLACLISSQHQVSAWFFPLLLSGGASIAVMIAILPWPKSLVDGLVLGARNTFPALGSLLSSLLHLKRDFDQFNRSRRRFAKTILQSLAVHLLMIAVATLPLVVEKSHVSLIHFWAAIPPAFLVAYLPISIAGWGVREGAMVVSLGLIGMSVEHAIAISLFIGLTVVMVSLLGGVLWLLSDARRLSKNASSEEVGEMGSS